MIFASIRVMHCKLNAFSQMWLPNQAKYICNVKFIMSVFVFALPAYTPILKSSYDFGAAVITGEYRKGNKVMMSTHTHNESDFFL